MSQHPAQENLKAEIQNPVEPLLPIEKKLIGWSLGIGVGLLILLLIANKLWPLG